MIAFRQKYVLAALLRALAYEHGVAGRLETQRSSTSTAAALLERIVASHEDRLACFKNTRADFSSPANSHRPSLLKIFRTAILAKEPLK